TGPGNAANLVETFAEQLLSTRGERDHRLRADLVTERGVRLLLTKVPVLVIVDVVLVDDLDAPQILRVEDAFEAGNHQAQRKPLLRTTRLAVHAVGHYAVVHGLRHRNGRRALHFLVALRKDPGRPAFDAGLLEQHRQQHSRPFGATRHPGRFLNGLRLGRRT